MRHSQKPQAPGLPNSNAQAQSRKRIAARVIPWGGASGAPGPVPLAIVNKNAGAWVQQAPASDIINGNPLVREDNKPDGRKGREAAQTSRAPLHIPPGPFCVAKGNHSANDTRRQVCRYESILKGGDNMILPRLHYPTLLSVWSQLERQGVTYGYGVKAPRLDCEPKEIHSIDCSGLIRYVVYQSSVGRLVLPDGSQAQREYMEQSGAHKLARYEDVSFAVPGRVFLCFIKPWEKGCGAVGHTWIVTKWPQQSSPWTIESHGGAGCTSRPAFYPVLLHEAFSAFELPTFGPQG